MQAVLHCALCNMDQPSEPFPTASIMGGQPMDALDTKRRLLDPIQDAVHSTAQEAKAAIGKTFSCEHPMPASWLNVSRKLTPTGNHILAR